MPPYPTYNLESLVVTLATVVGSGATSTWLNCVAAGLGAVILAGSFPRVRGTTLQAPLAWAMIAGIGLAVVEGLLLARSATVSSLAESILRYGAAVGTLCPLMAVLGAKRPQNRGWQWVVASLWLILMLPAAQAMLISPGGQFDLFAAWRLFLGAMIGLGLLNYLPTRFWLAAVLVAIGQALLLDKFLWDEPFVVAAWGRRLGVTCLLAAVLTVRFQLVGKNMPDRRESPRVRAPGLWEELEPHNRQWLRFRNAFGAFWALRILQRVNQTAEICDWPVRLTWTGFLPTDNASSDAMQPKHREEIDQMLQTLLRRFI